LPRKDQQENQIMAVRLKDADPSRFSNAGALKTYIMVQDAYMVETGTVSGYVFLIDLKGCGIGHVSRIKLSLLKLYADYMQVYFHICYLMTDNQMRIIYQFT
jgi:hypothetical protein